MSLCPMKVAKVDDGNLSKGDSRSLALSPGLPFPPRIHLDNQSKSRQHYTSFPGERARLDEVNSSSPTETIKDESNFGLLEPIKLKAAGS